MSISKLTFIVAPPERPIDHNAVDNVTRHETRLGLRLPRDIIELGKHFGSGGFNFGPRLEVFNPFSHDYYDIVWEHSCMLAGNRADVGSDRFPYEVYPTIPGLLPWASDDLGNEFCWFTAGQPDTWGVVVCSEEDEFESIELSALELLVAVYRGELVPQVWSESEVLNLTEPRFEPTSRPPVNEHPRTIYELYVRNGNRVGFWAREVDSQPGAVLYVKAIDGKTEGKLQGIPVEFERQSVQADLYHHNELFLENTNVNPAYQQRYLFADAPNPSTGVESPSRRGE